ncbi:hypothetical protein BKA70DRAFT_1563165 [Coprinopsis sp. MPI-PUGE-AT-0042]|nr:hypothetical protein BKA70DRAFT_1563165 [Coprinopsis sp. MPI-PUGE-AT-0042]
MHVFLTIPKIQASRPQWHKGRMWAGGGHGGGDEEDEEDNRRQRAHLNTPNSHSGLVTREGGDGFTEHRAQASQRLNSRHQRHSFLGPQEARTTTMTKTYHTSAHIDFLGCPPADVEANPRRAVPASDTRLGIGRKVASVETRDNHQAPRI